MDGDRTAMPDESTVRSDSLAQGDAAALSGRWPQAVAAWQQALSTSHRMAAIERLRWFVAWRSAGTSTIPTPQERSSTTTVLVLMAACGLIATGLVFVAGGISGIGYAVLVTAAWVLYGAAATLSLIYALRTGHQLRTTRGRWSRREVERLAAEAARLVEPERASVPVTTAPAEFGSQGSGL
jgi:hypothetical protein